ncbi:MAG: TIGR00730 family Rossman fold protein [Acidimicrobiaceae bacterium]|nr:TIGR00730 family Rossman fold protein [Acidimicrobiaceae bacterium]
MKDSSFDSSFDTSTSIESLVEELLNTANIKTNRRLIAELVTTSLHLGTDLPNTLNLKIASAALTEMRDAFAMFAPYVERKKVTIFGSARTTKDDPLYRLTEEVARSLAENGWMVVTGAGPGIMEAGMSGAGRDMSIGVSIRLPFETSANPIIAGDEKYVSMRYFFTRKLMLVKESNAFICMPGGFGTLDEMFELLTLSQTGKGNPVPIVMLDLPGDPFWESVDAFVRTTLVPRRLVSEADLALYHLALGVQDAVNEVVNFYRVYHSMRIVGKRIVLRLNSDLSDTALEQINIDFANLCESGGIEKVGASPSEVSDKDNLDKFRIAFHFARRDFGGLRRLINVLNRS